LLGQGFVLAREQINQLVFGDTTLTYKYSSQTVIYYRYRRIAVSVTTAPAKPNKIIIPGGKSIEYNININKPSENSVILIDTPKPIPKPRDILIAMSTSTRLGLKVPKAADERDVRGYMFILMSSIAAAMLLSLKKKEER